MVRYARSGLPALSGISFEASSGQTLAVVGPSGAGKTTLLRVLAGLLPAESGEIAVGSCSVVNSTPQERRMALVFAEDALLPHRSVERNLAFVARDHTQIEELTRTLEIAELRSRRPRALSSGERRRVSLARALLAQPFALLLDEPLAALDPELRALVREELVHVRERFAGPMVLVTHDHADAMTFAQTLAVLIDGRFEDIGDPQRVYDRPASVRAAAFLGTRPMNILPGHVLGEAPNVLIGLRPERARISNDGPLRGAVARIERTGADAYVSVDVPGGPILARVDARETLDLGREVAVAFDPLDLRRFDAQTGAAIV